MSVLIADLESDGLLDELTKIHCIVTKDYETENIHQYNSFHGLHLDRFLDRTTSSGNSGDCLVFHNGINFDIPAILKLYPEWQPPKVFDTLIACRLIWPNIKEKDFRRKNFPKELIGSHSLKAWGYRLGFKKGDFGETTDWKEWSQEMEDYCVTDVEVTYRLYKLILEQGYSQEALDLEFDFATLIGKQERHGFAFDKLKAVDLYTELSKRRNALEEQLQEVFPPTIVEMKTPSWWSCKTPEGQLAKAATKFDLQELMKMSGFSPKEYAESLEKGPNKTKSIPFNPGSRQEIEKRLVTKYGWKPRDYTPSGQAKINEAILSELPYEECEPLSEYFIVQKLIGQVAEGDNAWLKLERNGRIHGSVNTAGAATRRCSHIKPNVAQVPATDKPYGQTCRECFTADEGQVLVGWDASGLQLRCLAHYLAKYDGGAYVKKLLEDDIHTVNQKAAGLPTRANAKTFILIEQG